MRAHLKPATAKARSLLRKLQALAEKGIDGERLSAQRKIARLKTRFDFSTPDPSATPDLFSGTFKRASKARPIYAFVSHEFDVANAVKWAIESATKIPCLYRDGELLTQASAATATRLRKIADHIACSFRSLLKKFCATDGVSLSDRAVFVMGLYDGMMNEAREAGQRLPSRSRKVKKPRAKTNETISTSSLHVHPYTVAVSLGRQIRFSAPIDQINAELEAFIQKRLSSRTAAA